MFASDLMRACRLLWVLFLIHNKAPHMSAQKKLYHKHQYYVPGSQIFFQTILHLSFNWGSHVSLFHTELQYL